MQFRTLSILVGSVFLAGIIPNIAIPAYAADYTCSVTSLDGSQEVPSVGTDGTGSATMTFNSSSNELAWSISFSGLSGPATMAHFHGPALGGSNAGVLVNIGEISGLNSPMNGSAILTAEQATALLDGMMYINIHTAANEGGEIRGQVSCEQPGGGFQDTFDLEACDFSSIGSNNYFFLEPGFQLVLEGQDEGATIRLVLTVLDETKMVNGVETRVMEERETEDGELIEISKNYFAICEPANDIFYFGEDVDFYEEGEIVSHNGSWLAGEGDARPGIIIPNDPEVGFKYYQEIAPGVAEDRAEIISLDEVVLTPAGTFTDVLKVEETTPLEPDAIEFKYHAPGIGLIQDAELKLINYTLPEDDEIELTPSVQPVTVAGETITLDLNSSSTISEFALDEDSKSITFTVDGENRTAGLTEISIGRVLEGPYAVTIDGQVTDDVEVTQAAATGESIIRISYTHSAHDVVITGTNVVPEFPLSVIVVVAAVLGAVIFVGRSRLAGSFIR
ncbi:MAG TPA: CHRD domain-containing protein [Nitrososphaera sp.]|jgi:hypothetical protein